MSEQVTWLTDLLGEVSRAAESSRGLPRHRWYWMKESFSPALVDAAIEHDGCRDGDLVMDPFCGAGTVPLCAGLKGLHVLAIEVNPFLAFVSRTKLSRATAAVVRKHVPAVEEGAMNGAESPLEGYSTFTKARKRAGGLFNREVLAAFEGGWRAADSLDSRVRNLLRLALLGSAMDQCNAVRDGKALRYRDSLLEAEFDKESFVDSFKKRVEEIEEDLAVEMPTSPGVSIWTGDSRRRLRSATGRRFKICVTSPPYLNSFDYSDVYRPELFLGKFVASTEELRQLRQRTIRSHVQTSWAEPKCSDFGSRFQICWQAIQDRSQELWDARIPLMVQAYFEDMSRVLAKLRLAAGEGASVWLVVSTSAYGGVEVPVDLILADIGCQAGWHLRDVHVLRHLRSSGQHWSAQEQRSSERRKPPLRESLVIFDERPTRGRSRVSASQDGLALSESAAKPQLSHSPPVILDRQSPSALNLDPERKARS